MDEVMRIVLEIAKRSAPRSMPETCFRSAETGRYPINAARVYLIGHAILCKQSIAKMWIVGMGLATRRRGDVDVSVLIRSVTSCHPLSGKFCWMNVGGILNWSPGPK